VNEYIKEQNDKMNDDDKKAYGDYDGQMQAESDAHTLMEYHRLMKDGKRKKRANYCLRKKADELAEIKRGA